jgi:hypothetical protein
MLGKDIGQLMMKFDYLYMNNLYIHFYIFIYLYI